MIDLVWGKCIWKFSPGRFGRPIETKVLNCLLDLQRDDGPSDAPRPPRPPRDEQRGLQRGGGALAVSAAVFGRVDGDHDDGGEDAAGRVSRM